MNEIYAISDSAEETESDSLNLLKELIRKPVKPAPGTLTCPRCKSHVWKLRLEPNKDFFTLECRHCLSELFVEFCDNFEGED